MDIVSKINGNTLGATEFNQIPTELETGISASGQTPSDSVLNQVPIFVSRFAANNFYIDSGSANAYVLTLAASMTNPVSSTVGYYVGMTIRFRAGNANTGASTVNVNGAGVKSIVQTDGSTALTVGMISTGHDVLARYNGTSFILQGTASQYNVGVSSGNVPLIGTQSATSSLAGLGYATYMSFFGYSSSTAISVTAGLFNFSDGTGQAKNSYSGTKTLSSWAAGSGNGGLDTGTIANNTWYYAYSIYNPTSGATDYLISASSSSPTLPSGYTKYKRLRGFFKTNGSAQIITCTISQDGTWTNSTSVVAEQTLVSATSQSGSTGSVAGAFPAVFNSPIVEFEMSTNTTGYSSFTVWGNLQSTPTTATPSASGLRASSIGTNNGFGVAGTGILYNDDGILLFRNFEIGGGVSNIKVALLSIRDLSTNI